MNSKTCIVIPCYNEENGLDVQAYLHFLKQNTLVTICFVNDGSKDETLLVLSKIQNQFPKQVLVKSYEKNIGKAEAIRFGINSLITSDFDYLAYLDADLATSLEECVSLISNFDSEISFVFGSRIKKIGSDIQRHRYRFIIGRTIATAISYILKLPVYDTQCGCKIMKKEVAEIIFKDAFISKWLFDVELFNRLINLYRRPLVLKKLMEVPLKKWEDKGDSKVKFTYFFKLWIDLYKIKKTCKN